MADEEDVSNLPLTERWSHTSWKVRKAAYEEATQEFKKASDESNPVVSEFTFDSGLWKTAVADSNVAAQQEALAALCAFLQVGGTQACTRTRGYTIVSVVEKGLLGRPAAKASSTEAILMYIELDKPDPVIEELLPLLGHKLAKVIAATLSILTTIVHAYGCKTIEPKLIIKQLPKAYGHADKNVRSEAQNLTVELFRWLKDAMKPLFWDELKPVQQGDLEKLFEKVRAEPMPKQERFLLSQQAIENKKSAAIGGADEDEEEEAAEDQGIDLEPELITVDVLKKIPEDLQERATSSQWKERKAVMDEVCAAVNVPAIEDGSFDEIVRICAKCMSDANIQVVQAAANSIEYLAKGLRKKFAKYRNIILAPMLERLKEKKQSVTDALANACDALFASTGLDDLLEESLEFLKHKNPQVKLESARFITRCLKSTRIAPQIPQVKLMADAAKPLLSESQEPTRNAGAELLGVLWKIMTDKNMLMHMEGIEEIRKNKIIEFRDQAEVKAKWKPQVATAPSRSAGPPAARKGAPVANKKPMTKKPTAAPQPRAISPPLNEQPSKPTVRPLSKIGGAAPRSLPPAAAAGLKKPGLARPTSMMSPSRPKSQIDDTTSIQPPRGLPTPSRGLASRPLSTKPGSISTSFDRSPPATPRASSQTSNLSLAERSDLSDLRAEAELLRQQNSDLRTDKLRLQSQIQELQNQNAQLIEDHTRDMLSVKAKETQLVRARSDLEEAEDRANTLMREMDRFKRTMSASGAISPPLFPTSANGKNGISRLATNIDSMSGGVEGKENALPRELLLPQKLKDTASTSTRVTSPVLEDDNNNNTGSRQNQSEFQRPTGKPLNNFIQQQRQQQQQRQVQEQGQLDDTAASNRTNTMSRVGSGSFAAPTRSGDNESWKRAAEVTQNLKARIEMMKVC